MNPSIQRKIELSMKSVSKGKKILTLEYFFTII
jgi:hypothetical protein